MVDTSCCCGLESTGNECSVLRIIERHRDQKSPLLPILNDIQREMGRISKSSATIVAEALNIPAARVYSVLTFYTLYSTECKGKNVIRVCESAPCHVEGAQAIVEALQSSLGIKMGQTTRDKLFSLEFTSCIGVCGVAPAIMINDRVHGNLTPGMIPQILAACKATA